MKGAEPVLLCGDMSVKTLHAGIFLGISLCGQGDVIVAFRGEIRAEDVGPIASTRPQLHHRHRGRKTKESQLFDGMTGRVPRHRGGAARRAPDRAHQRSIRVRGGRGRDGPDEGEQGRSDQCTEAGTLHGYTYLDTFIERQYHKFAGAASRHLARGAQVGGISPVNGIGVAPVTVPMVALSLTKSRTVRSKGSSPCTVAPGPITIRGTS